MVSSTDQKSYSGAYDLLTDRTNKQFKAMDALSGKKRCRGFDRVRSPPIIRTIWPSSTMTLEKQPSGNPIEFDLYDERDLPFLDKSTEVGRMVS